MKKEGVFFAPHGSKQCASSKKRRCCHHASLNPINVSRHQRHRDETKLGAWAINSYPHKPKLKPLEAQRKNEQKKKQMTAAVMSEKRLTDAARQNI